MTYRAEQYIPNRTMKQQMSHKSVAYFKFAKCLGQRFLSHFNNRFFFVLHFIHLTTSIIISENMLHFVHIIRANCQIYSFK